MRLNPISIGPEPSKAQIARQLRQSSIGSRLPKKLQPIWAAFEWRVEKQETDPNAFLVGFAPDRYEQYLLTPEWRTISDQVLRENNYTCQCCSGKATEVHHRDYRPRVLSGEDTTPLVAICRTCHLKVEKGKLISWNEGERILAELVRKNRTPRRER